MGLLLGKVDGNNMIVTDSFALPVEGTETRVNAQAQAYEYMAAYIEAAKQVSLQFNRPPVYCRLLRAGYYYSLDQHVKAEIIQRLVARGFTKIYMITLHQFLKIYTSCLLNMPLNLRLRVVISL